MDFIFFLLAHLLHYVHHLLNILRWNVPGYSFRSVCCSKNSASLS